MMPNRPLSDPPIRALFVREIRVTIEDGMAHLVGYMRDGEPIAVAHLVMSTEALRRLLADGRAKLARNAQ